MDSFGGFGATREVEVDLLTDAYRISGILETRFGRVTDILNQQAGTHVTIRRATIREHADPDATTATPSALVAVTAILLMSAPGLTGDASPDMVIQKRGVNAQFAIPPFRITGKIHVPPASRPSEGVIHMTDKFLAMTDVTISSSAYPDLAQTAPAAALSRDRAQLLLISDDDPEDELAEVLDETTAEAWLRPDDGQG
jgi:hypothetical protein